MKFAIDNYSNQKEIILKISNNDKIEEYKEIKIRVHHGLNVIDIPSEYFQQGKKFIVNCPNLNSNAYSFYVLLQD